jgi:tocopherol cyclase
MRLPTRRTIFETLHPDIYHGLRAGRPFFEGWYFKVIDGAQENAWAIIPGIYKDYDPALDEAFVMVLDGRSNQVTFHTYPVSEFAASRNNFNIRIGPNFFAAEYLTLNLPNLRGHLSFQGLNPWPVSWRAPGIMGWYAWFPMECYHGVVSMDHTVEGFLHDGKRRFNFGSGRGYIEKDWGRNFPQTWTWIQANHFNQTTASLSASIARIPFYGRVFPGFIIGLLLDGRLFQFATYLGSTLEEVTVSNKQVKIVVRSKEAVLEISGAQGQTALLHAPAPGQGMVPRVHESIDATATIRLQDANGSIIYEGTSNHAGMEIEGNTSILIK